MARGRMINNKICMNKAVAELSDDTCRLAWTWLVTFADVDGRTYGDPAVLRAMLFPRRGDISIEMMEGYIAEWACAGLVVWYEADDDLWLELPKFEDNQKGLDRRKEPASTIVPSTQADRILAGVCPEPEEKQADDADGTEPVRTGSVPSTCQVPGNRTEGKLTEQKVSTALPPAQAQPEPEPRDPAIEVLESNGANLWAQIEREEWMDVLKVTRDPELLQEAFDEANKLNKKARPRYIESMVSRCVRDNCRPGEWSKASKARGSPKKEPVPYMPALEEFRHPITGEIMHQTKAPSNGNR